MKVSTFDAFYNNRPLAFCIAVFLTAKRFLMLNTKTTDKRNSDFELFFFCDVNVSECCTVWKWKNNVFKALIAHAYDQNDLS